jgi:histidine triad (HIT) family protein
LFGRELAMESPSCKFCDIIKRRLPASFVYDSSKLVAFMDAFPISLGHILVVPSIHYTSIFEVPEDLAVESFRLARRICVATRSALRNIEGVNLLQNNGDSAGQKIPHFHIHVIPRARMVRDDTRWTPIRKPADRRLLDEIAEKIRLKLMEASDASCDEHR